MLNNGEERDGTTQLGVNRTRIAKPEAGQASYLDATPTDACDAPSATRRRRATPLVGVARAPRRRLPLVPLIAQRQQRRLIDDTPLFDHWAVGHLTNGRLNDPSLPHLDFSHNLIIVAATSLLLNAPFRPSADTARRFDDAALLNAGQRRAGAPPGCQDGGVGRNARQGASLETDGGRRPLVGQRLKQLLRLAGIPRRRVPLALLVRQSCIRPGGCNGNERHDNDG